MSSRQPGAHRSRPARPRPAGWRRSGGVALTGLSWLLVCVVAAVVLAFVVVPRLTGSEPLTVLTGSMRPALAPGALVVVRPTPFDEVRVGDVVTYQLRSGEPALVTHRVVGVDVTPDGPRLRTRGDANPAPDPELVRPEQVRGTVWYSAPWLGTASTWVGPEARVWAARSLGLLLLGYAAFAFTRAVRERGPRGDSSANPEPSTPGPRSLTEEGDHLPPSSTGDTT